MDQKTFKALLKHYLSCIDVEEIAHLKLRKDQENKSYVFLHHDEALFSKDVPYLEIPITDNRHKNFIERKATNTETLIDLHYGFPVYKDEKDMLSPLFFVKVKVDFSDRNTLRIFPQDKRFSVNRMHFIKQYGAEETQRICEELEGEYGSFAARMKASETYIPSLWKKLPDTWIEQPMLFRTNYSSSRAGLRYDLTYLLKVKDGHSKNTALKYFLQSAVPENTINKLQPSVLEVESLNIQQQEAVEKGLSEPLSVVTGPPGTGKTQVVTALLASAVYNNETVLFASNNNMPVDCLYDRLGKSTGTIGNWLMRLGNQNKRQICYQTMSSLLERVNTMNLSKFNLYDEQEKLLELERNIKQEQVSLSKALHLQEDISSLHKKEKILEQKLPKFWVQQFSKIDPTSLNQTALKKLKKHSHYGFRLWLRKKLFGLEKFLAKQNILLTKLCEDDPCLSEYESWLLIDEPWDEAVSKAQKVVEYLLQHQAWNLCIQKRRRLEEKIAHCASISDIADLKNQKSNLSKKLFEKWWLTNIQGHVAEATEAFKNYFKDIDSYDAGRHRRLEKALNALKQFFPIWIITNQSTSAILPPQDALFDLLVIDEAGQCDIPSIIPLLYRAKRAVIIGDPQQFKHITSLKVDVEYAIAKEIGIENILDEWSFTRKSAFDRSHTSTHSRSFLKQHYRCHSDIIQFSNLNFYDGKLVEQVALSQFQSKLPIEEHGLIWCNTVGQALKAKKGAWNPTEIKKTVNLFERWAKQGLFSHPDITYGVVTPFLKQVEEMRIALSSCVWFQAVESRFIIGTAHSFQGRECDVLVYSPVVADGIEDYLIKFAAGQKDLINVSVTRAKNLLYIVGDLHACQTTSASTPLYQLAAYAERIRKQQKYPLNSAEKAMSAILETLKLSYTAQYEFEGYRLDFMVNSPSGERYDIEVDGDIHLTAEAIQHDERRDAYVESRDLKILRFSARDVLYKPELIKERLMRI